MANGISLSTILLLCVARNLLRCWNSIWKTRLACNLTRDMWQIKEFSRTRDWISFFRVNSRTVINNMTCETRSRYIMQILQCRSAIGLWFVYSFTYVLISSRSLLFQRFSRWFKQFSRIATGEVLPSGATTIAIKNCHCVPRYWNMPKRRFLQTKALFTAFHCQTRVNEIC